MATIVLEIPESLAARLLNQAEAQQVPVETVVQQVLDERFPEPMLTASGRRWLPEIRGGDSGDPDFAENIDKELAATWANDIERDS